MATAEGGAGLKLPLGGSASAYAFGAAGYYFGTLNDFSLHATDPYLGAGAGIELSLNPTISLRFGVQYDAYLGLYQGLSFGVGSAFALGATRAANESTFMGVRSANKGVQSEGSWFSSEAGVYLQAGKTFLQEGHFDEAVAQFDQGLKVAQSSEAPELRFYLAYAYSLAGKTLDALKELHRLSPDPGQTWTADYELLRAKLLVDTYAFKESVAWLTGPAAALSRDSRRAPIYYLLLGVSYHGIGNLELARKNLATAVQLGGDSDVARAAARLSAQL